MAKPKKDLLSFDRGDDWVGPYERQRRLEEEERLRLEEARKKANFDNVDSGVTVGMSLDSYGRPQGTELIEPKAAPKEDFGRWDAFNSSRRGSDDITEAAFIQDELGDLEAKYRTPEQRSAARARYEEERARGLMDRSTFSMATNAAKELGRISQAEALFSNPEKVEATKAKMQELKARGQAQSQAAENFFKDNDAYLTRTAADMYNSRLSALPLATGLAAGAVGGYLSGGTLAGPAAAAGSAVGALPGANQARAVAYAEAKDAGMPEEDARQFSMVMAGSDFVLSALGQGGAALMSSVVKQEIKKRVTTSLMKKVLTTVPKQVGLGAGEEALTSGLQAGIRATYAQNEEFSKATRDYLAQTAHVNPDGTVDWSAAVADMARSAAAGGVTTATLSTPVETFVVMKEMGKQASKLQEYLANQGYNKEANDIAKAAKNPVFSEPVQEDMFGGRMEIPIEPLSPTPGNVGIDTDGIQARLRTQADAVRAQLEADRERLAGFQTRIERAPFAEDQADLLTNQERTDMPRIQERVASQETLLRELEAQQTPTQPELGLQGRNQPKNPKFTGQERTVDQIKSDYFRTQPVQGPQNMTTAQRKAVQKDILEETKRTKAETKKANDKVKAAHAASRRKYLDGQRAGLLDLPVEERAKRLAEAGREWDTANPLVLPTAPVATKPAAAPAEAQEAEASVPVSTLTEGLQGTPQGTVPLPSTAQAPAQGTTLEDVRKAVGGGKRDKLASRLSYMVEDGNLEIIESQDQIPGDIGEMEDQGKGWYDPNTGKTYLVASNLDPANVRGDILATLAHETKHSADFGGSEGLARSFKRFVGAEANTKMGEKIRAAAKAGDKSAQFAVKQIAEATYKKLNLTGDQLDSELVANYLTAEHTKTGIKSGLYRGIVSPLRAGAKKLVGGEVNIKDIHYMADRLVSEVAQRGERIEASNGIALPMTISGGRTEAEQLSKGRTWLSADGKRKYEISDENSEVRLPEDVKIGKKYPITQVLSHNRLYNELPELKDVTISFEPVEGGGASFDVEDNHITVDSNDELAFNGDVSGGKYKYDGILHRYIIHEMQHAAQKVSGSTSGSNPISFLSPEGKKADARIKELEGAIAHGQSIGMDNAELVDMASELDSQVETYNTEAKKATEKYMSGLGEREAHRSMYTIQDSDEALDADGKGQQESRWDKKPGGLTNSTGKKLKPLVQEQPAKKAAAMPSVAEQSEKDNRSWWNKKKDSSAAIRVMDDLLSTTEGLGTDLFKLFDARQGLRGDLSLRAEAVGSSAEQSLRNAAKSSGRTLKQTATQVEKELEAINKLTSRAEREAAVKALDKTYPGLGTALTDLRNLKWSLSRAIIEQRAKQGTDMTPKETAIYGAILQNAETYTTRAYMSNQIRGKKFAKRRLENIKNAPDSEEATKFNEALQFLMDKHLVIPTNQELQAMEGKDIRKLYEQWIGDSSGVEVGTMAEKLNAIPRKTQEEYRAKAEIIAKELMGATKAKSLTARGYGGARQNRTILEGRENVPQEIRFLMGEITNPVAAEMMSVARLVNLYSQTKMLQDMADKGKDKWYKDHNEGDFNTLLKDDAYGPMKGKWVSPTASKFLEPAVNVGMDLEQALSTSGKDLGRIAGMVAAASVDVLRKGTSLVKLADLVTSPAAMAWNYIGAYGIAAQNGVINPAKWAHAQKMTANAIGAHYKPNAFKGEDQKAIQELIRSRVLDSATVGEFQQSFYDNMFRLLEDEQGGQGKWDKVKRAISDGTMVAKDAYAFMDMWAKVAAYYDRKDYLTKFYEANGDKVDSEAIIREAGFDITAANISYTRALKAVKIAERNIPMFTMYLTYFSEVPRSLVASSFLAAADFKRAKNAKTPKAAALAAGAGMSRAAGTLAMTAGLTSLINMYLSGLDKDEERRRKTDPEWEQKGMPIPIGKTKDGKLVTTNILRADPNGPMTEFMVHMSNLKENEDLGDALIKTLKSQFVEAKPIKDTFRLIRGLAGKETYNNDDGFGDFADSLDDMSWGKEENLGRNFMSVLEGFTPKIVKGTYRSLNGTIGKRKYEFDPAKELDVAAMQGSGITPSVRDPEFSLEMATSKYKKQKAEAAKELNGMKGKLGRMGGEALIDKLSDVVEDERKAYQSLWEVYDGTKAFNGYYTDKDYAKAANGILKEAKIGPAGNDVANGSFNVRFISKDYINAWRDARIEKIKEMEPNKKSKAMAQLRQDYKMVADYLGTRE